MYAEEYPGGLVGLRARPDLFEVVMLLFLAEAYLEPARPILRDGRGQLFRLSLVLSRPPLTLEVGSDILPGGVYPVPVSGVYRVASVQPGPSLG